MATDDASKQQQQQQSDIDENIWPLHCSIDALCKNCRYMHKQIPNTQLAENEFYRTFETVPQTDSERLQATCPLCRLLGYICPSESHMAAGVYDYDLAEVNLFKTEGERTKLFFSGHGSVYVGVVPPPNNGSGRESIQPRLMHKDVIDYDVIRGWLSSCKTEHGEDCCTSKRDIISLRLQVLDVDSRRIVAAPHDCEYVALSYVWGTSSGSSFPAVVEDSLQVTKKLGYQYLWVDKYCISQDATERDHQIASMYMVYGNADLTIIAAAGEDANYGLPGVGQRHRVPQYALQVDGTVYALSGSGPREEIEESRWMSRGWTLQEDLLSNRRLVFTDYEVAFQCNESYYLESMHWPEATRRNGIYQTVTRMPLRESILTSGRKHTMDYSTFYRIVDNYSRRTLSYPEVDFLNALRGILGALSAPPVNLYHIWGVPVFHSAHSAQETHLVMDWYHKKPCRRISQFPSWSWVGWLGPVFWKDNERGHGDAKGILHVGIHAKQTTTETPEISLDQFVHENDHCSRSLYAVGAPFLRLRTWVYFVDFVWVPWATMQSVDIPRGIDDKEVFRARIQSMGLPRHGNCDDDEKEKEAPTSSGFLYAAWKFDDRDELLEVFLDASDCDPETLHSKTMPCLKANYSRCPFSPLIVLRHISGSRYERLGYVHPANREYPHAIDLGPSHQFAVYRMKKEPDVGRVVVKWPKDEIEPVRPDEDAAWCTNEQVMDIFLE